MVETQVEICPILLGLLIVLTAAKLGEYCAKGLELPQVVGEFSMGMLLGNFCLFTGWQSFDFIKEILFLRTMGDLGAITLLLTIGLHTDLQAILRVGLSSFFVAFLGIVAPAWLGFLVCQVFVPQITLHSKLFLICAICVNSVGIAIRVFQEFGKLDSPEARIVISASLLDAIIIFVLLGALSSTMQVGHLQTKKVMVSGGLATGFLLGIVMVSLKYSQAIGELTSKRFTESLRVFVVLTACLSLTYVAGMIGIVPIVGAFGAGLLLRDVRARNSPGNEQSMEALIQPAYWTLVPIFFVLLGSQVRLESFLDKNAILIGISLTGAAVLGKLIAGLGVVKGGINRLWIGVGMIPRAEMALIVAGIGVANGSVDHHVYSAIIIMVVLTSLLGPLFLKILLHALEGLEGTKQRERGEI